jgi:hypothetical protein
MLKMVSRESQNSNPRRIHSSKITRSAIPRKRVQQGHFYTHPQDGRGLHANGFIMNAMKVKDAIRPTWPRVILSLVPAYILGWVIGPVLYHFSSCWLDTDCAAYSPTRIALSYLLSWPIFLLGSLLEKYAHVLLNFDTFYPFAPEFLLLWLYYYLLVSVTDAILLSRRKKSPA